MSNQVEWISLGAITSDRDLVSGEKLQVLLVENQGTGLIEKLEFKPLSSQLGRYKWPHALASHINQTATHLRAGVKQADGSFKPEFSTYLNKLWALDHPGRAVLTTACKLDSWADLGALSSTGSLPKGSSITCRLSNQKGVVYQTLECAVPDDQGGRYKWPGYLCSFINTQGGLLRGGEKDQPSSTFVTIGSSYRNHLWAPTGAALHVARHFILSNSARANALKTYEAVCAQVVKPPPAVELINSWLAGFVDGKYQDLSYPSPAVPISDVSVLTTHLDRTVQIASYLYKQGVALPSDYVSKAAQALNFYAAQDYQTSNWWFRQVGLAKLASIAGLLLAKYLSPRALMDVYIPYAMKTTTTFAHVQTGANLADFAAIQVKWSLCAWKNSNEDEYLLYLKDAADSLSGLCFPVERYGKEHGAGVSVDYSISQHNPLHDDRYYSQLYSGGYGYELLGRIFESMTVLQGEFALLPGAQIELIRLMLEGMGWMGYARYLDFHVQGRGISRSSKSIAHYVKWAETLVPVADEDSRKKLTELIRRASGDESNNLYYKGGRIFWVNDYMTYMGKSFCLWAKAVSTRTVGSESGNGENPKGYYMGAGTYLLSRHGQEYESIQPVWDWQRLPGSTVEQVTNFAWPNIDWGQNAWGSHDFAGGTCLGGKSLLSMELSRKNVTHAYKTVMAIDNRVLCIGTEINSDKASHPVVTSVNQCIARGPIHYMDFQGSVFDVALGESITSANIRKVYHDGFVYSFGVMGFQPSITLEVKIKRGAWSDINVDGSPDIVERQVFSLWVNHPQRENAGYLYEIEPADSLRDTGSRLSVEVTSDAHIVSDGYSFLMGTVFTAQSSNSKAREGAATIIPEQPCSFIYQLENTQFRLTCADPTQTLESLSFIVAMDEQGAPQRRIEVLLPQGDERGRSVTGVYPL